MSFYSFDFSLQIQCRRDFSANCRGTHTHNTGKTYDLLLRVLVGAQQVDRLHVAEVDVVSEQEDEEQLADVLLLAVAIESLVPFELGADVGQLFVDPLDFGFLALT